MFGGLPAPTAAQLVSCLVPPATQAVPPVRRLGGLETHPRRQPTLAVLACRSGDWARVPVQVVLIALFESTALVDDEIAIVIFEATGRPATGLG